MTRVALFNSPFLLGFDQMEEWLNRVAKSGNEAYPPYNVEQLPEDEAASGARLALTFAVAGFTRADLSVSVEENQLIVRGKAGSEPARSYLHQGIAKRQFQRAFVMADGFKVAGAKLENGLLSIDLRRPEPSGHIQIIDIIDADADAEEEADR